VIFNPLNHFYSFLSFYRKEGMIPVADVIKDYLKLVNDILLISTDTLIM